MSTTYDFIEKYLQFICMIPDIYSIPLMHTGCKCLKLLTAFTLLLHQEDDLMPSHQVALLAL